VTEPIPFDRRLAEIDRRLAGFDARYVEWNWRLAEQQRELVDGGVDFWRALDIASAQRDESIESGDCLVDLEALNSLLDELCGLYLEADRRGRIAIRGLFDGKQSLLNHLHSYIARASRLLGSSRDRKWLRLGLAAASIGDMRVDWRDLLICLGDLYLTAKRVHVRPGRDFQAVARLSNPVGRDDERSMRDLLAGFHKSAYLRSIKRKTRTRRRGRTPDESDGLEESS